ncbi:hypothetical protein [Bradyrhizobium denitrificans]|uniref:hypothetical protein n=1 Tax=Bradyrhizobium denitrificans TaxID=2734912 RepID=UPI001555CC71|nr:hypothetical protein [Bradyrhizobium sp. LMG 8443]NPU23915.1 hypothetical protein [Bradyrhizobium sp. LMG 8443]
MADYYPPISRAIGELGPGALVGDRYVVYARARKALFERLRSNPQLSESDIEHQQMLLEEAIDRVEAEHGRSSGISAVWSRFRRLLGSDLDGRRSTETSSTEADPLAELARLIGQNDPFASHMSQPERAEPEANFDSALFGHLDAVQNLEGDVVETFVDRDDPRTSRSRLPPINAIPEQDLTRAFAFSPTRKGPLDLVLDPPTDPHDREQSELYARIRRQLKKLKEDTPSQERSQVDDAIDDFLDNHPEDWSKVEYKKLVWLSGNSLRSLLAQHDSVKSDPEHYSKLPPSVAERLRNPVQAWSIFVQGDPHLAELDRYSLGPQEQQQVRESLKAAEPIILKAAQDRQITTEKAANAIGSTFRSASVDAADVNTKLAQELAERTNRNLFSQIARRGYLWVEEINDPESPASKELAASIAKGAVGAVASTAVVAAIHHALPFLEFVATNLPAIKQYVVVAFQHTQMGEIVDALAFEYNRIKHLYQKASLG